MTPEQAERMASASSNARELRLITALERQAQALDMISQTLSMLFFKMYEENCAEEITKLLTAPTAEIVMKDRD